MTTNLVSLIKQFIKSNGNTGAYLNQVIKGILALALALA